MKPADGRSVRGGGMAKQGPETMEMQNRNMMNYCPDIKVFDATMRDGGLVNNFGFTDEFVRDLYRANLAAGVDYMEFGYRASKNMFKVSDFGKWKFSDEEDIRAVVGENKTPLKIAVMADAGRCDYKTDILPKKDSVVDVIRVACYIHQIPLAIDMIEDAKAKGYEVTCNLMAVSKVPGEDLEKGIKMIAASPVDVLYLVDSFGYFCPEQIAGLAKKYVEAMQGRETGFHGHNNQQLAFANTIDRQRHGARRGELLLGAAAELPQEPEVQRAADPRIRAEAHAQDEDRRLEVGLRHSLSADGGDELPSALGHQVHRRQPHGLRQLRARVDGDGLSGLRFGGDELRHLRREQAGGVEVREVAPFERDPVLLCGGGGAFGQCQAVDEVDFGMWLAMLPELVLDDAQENARRCVDAHLLLYFAHERLSARFAELDVSAGKIGRCAALCAAEEHLAVLDADAAGDRLDPRQFVFGKVHNG